MEDFNSEILGSSCSFPSEPPDIRNWFSSYKYESFVLDTCENLGGIVSEETEINRDEFEIGEINREKIDNFDGSGGIRKADEHGKLNSNEEFSHSSPILSEPPDIRNWFSSYEYESPLLDTNDGLQSCVPRESECEKDELAIEEKIKFTVELANLGQFKETNNGCKQELVKCSSSSAERKNESSTLFSEPPDIGKWFPDYVYESPVLDTSDELGDALSKDRESNDDKYVVEESKREEQENSNTTRKTSHSYEVVVGKKLCSNELGKCTSFLINDEQENSKDLCSEKILDSRLEVKQVQGSSINTEEGVENSVFNGEEHISRNPGKNDRKSSKASIDKKGGMEKSSETKVQTDKVDLESHHHNWHDQVSPASQSIHGSNNKENEAKDIAENGFITTRKNKFTNTNDENSLIGRQQSLLQCSTNKGGEKDGVIKRKVLAESTNVQHNEAMEITGKWRCPQKSKPSRGPPLKQLRLEQWIQRA
ncbi:hypothetical protein CCACVL1_24755 [Corchorus capsularis]|uniref:Uncharacterized protein n=1 Tax=Corchorus capsularis TaxID=210143 RepID=A0A1R3GN73_COCAP|nr:hypothetical protein CCACVL1_24755 [Corchorus capsularis]